VVMRRSFLRGLRSAALTFGSLARRAPQAPRGCPAGRALGRIPGAGLDGTAPEGARSIIHDQPGLRLKVTSR